MQAFLNAVKAHAAALDGARGQPRFGLVTSVDPARYAVRVTLQPEGVLTGWLPVLSAWVGANWGLTCLPSPGDQVFVLPQEGEAEHGVVVGASYSDTARAPVSNVGELQFTHKSGAAIRLAADGTVRVTGDLHVTGDVFDSHGSLAALRSHYNAHTHPGGASSQPSPQD